MKPLAQYLAENTKTYNYRIKIVGDIDAELEKNFKEQLKKFEPVSIKDIKKTPILAKPTDFPNFTNQAVNMMDVEFRYPAIPPQIEQIAKNVGLPLDRLCIKDLKWSEGMDAELLGIEDQKELLTSDYPSDTAEQKKLSKEYGDGNQQVVANSAEGATWEVAGGKTPPAATTNQLPQGVESPMTRVKRPPKPEVGRKI